MFLRCSTASRLKTLKTDLKVSEDLLFCVKCSSNYPCRSQIILILCAHFRWTFISTIENPVTIWHSRVLECSFNGKQHVCSVQFEIVSRTLTFGPCKIHSEHLITCSSCWCFCWVSSLICLLNLTGSFCELTCLMFACSLQSPLTSGEVTILYNQQPLVVVLRWFARLSTAHWAGVLIG